MKQTSSMTFCKLFMRKNSDLLNLLKFPAVTRKNIKTFQTF